MRHRWQAGLLPLMALLACASPAPQVSAPEPSPLLWRAERGDGSGPLFLFGSVHFGTPETFDFGGALVRAWERSEELVVEVDLTRASPQEIAATTLRYGLLPEGQDLRSQVSPETWDDLVGQLEQTGIPVHAFSRLKPWLAGLSLVTLRLQAGGLDPEYGVDRQLISRAAGGKPIVALESFESQFSMFDSLPAKVQELMLVEALTRLDDVEGDSTRIVEAWRRGDEKALVELFFGGQEEHPEFSSLYEKVYYERNEAMTRRLAQLSRDGKTRLAVVGAGHMVGPRGIPALLEARGFRVERMR